MLDSEHSQLSFRVNQNKRNNQKICENVMFDKDLDWLGRTFSWYQSQKWWCHCNSPVFYYMWLSLHKFWWHTQKIYVGAWPNSLDWRPPWYCLVKFMFSKKATKIEEIFTVDLTLCSKCQINGEYFTNFCGLLRKHELYLLCYKQTNNFFLY